MLLEHSTAGAWTWNCLAPGWSYNHPTVPYWEMQGCLWSLGPMFVKQINASFPLSPLIHSLVWVTRERFKKKLHDHVTLFLPLSPCCRLSNGLRINCELLSTAHNTFDYLPTPPLASLVILAVWISVHFWNLGCLPPPSLWVCTPSHPGFPLSSPVLRTLELYLLYEDPPTWMSPSPLCG